MKSAPGGSSPETKSHEYVGLVLAAGAGKRMGGPKALLAVRWGEGPGELPLAIAHARSMLDGGAERVVIVTRADAARELNRFAQRGLDIVVSTAEEDLGPAGSIRHALDFLAASPSEKSAPVLALVTPVDTPPASHGTRSALVAAVAAGAVAARPTFEGKRGHPVLIRIDALAALPHVEPQSLREVLRNLGDACVDVAVDDARATVDLDAPADVVAWYKTEPRFFGDAPDDD